MRKLAFAAVLVLVASIASAETGKSSVFASGTLIALPDGPTGPATLLSGTIAKGKKKNALHVSADMQVDLTNPSLPFLSVNVNGVPANGPTVETDCKFGGDQRCTLAGNWWLDLDAAEAAHPGMFVGKPLLVELVGGDGTFSPPFPGLAIGATLNVLMVKK